MFRFRERKESAGTRTCELPGKPGRKCIGALHRKIMEELYAVIEKKIKDSGYPEQMYMRTSATRLRGKRMEATFFCLNSKTM